MSRSFGRQLRVGAQIRRVLNELLRTEVKDPRLASVQVNEVDLSGDLGVAKIYFSTLVPDADPAPVIEAFASAHGFLRSRVGHALGLRRAPDLRFYPDTSAKQGFEISDLIDRSHRSVED
jgi:ribosome-binding factor A